jgi:hypothetical protein
MFPSSANGAECISDLTWRALLSQVRINELNDFVSAAVQYGTQLVP